MQGHCRQFRHRHVRVHHKWKDSSIKDVHHIHGLLAQGDEIKEPPQKYVPGLFEKYT